MTSIISRAKDAAIAVAAKPLINANIKGYGEVTSLQIDSTNKQLHLELALKGEESLVRVDVLEYRIVSKDGNANIELGEITVSREWMQHLLNEFLPPEKRVFPVPDAVRVLL